jgi:glycosyltransferase involved in cell wall biosynthesis
VDYIGFLQPSELAEKALNNSSVLVVPLSNHPIAQYATSPMKLVEYMATKIPIVAVDHPSITTLAGSESIHLSTTDPIEFYKTIINAIEENHDKKRSESTQQTYSFNSIAITIEQVDTINGYLKSYLASLRLLSDNLYLDCIESRKAA